MAPSTIVIISILLFIVSNIGGLVWIHSLLRIGKWSLSYLTTLAVIASPILTGVVFRMGQWLNDGHGIWWGCYFEDVLIIQWILMVLMYFCATIVLLVGLVKPSLIGLKNRSNVLIAYILSLICPAPIMSLTVLITPIISGPLRGTCL